MFWGDLEGAGCGLIQPPPLSSNIQEPRSIRVNRNSLKTDEAKVADLLNKEIHEKHKNLPEDLKIPFLFIDPVSHIFKDPCDDETREVTVREKEQFRKYTDR